MEISYLNEFLTIVECGKYADAAEKLYVTPSSLSKHIKALEEELGVPLFDRTKRVLALNSYGEALVPYARKIVHLGNDIRTKIQDISWDEGETLTVTTEYRIFEEAFSFRQETGINVIINEFREALSDVKKGTCDIGIAVDADREDKEVTFYPFKTDRLMIICSRKHPLADRQEVGLQELKDEDFVLFPKAMGSPLSRKIYNAFDKAGYTPRLAMTATVGSTLAKLVAQGAGVGILWEKATRNIMTPEIAMVPIKPEILSQIDLCVRKDAVLTEKAEEFLNFMLERKDLS
jgi:LysR family transcriptional activator of glutamate synthase operon